MDFSFGTLELNRTNPAHLGTKEIVSPTYTISADGKIHPIENVSKNLSSSEIQKTGKSNSTFQTYLLDALNQVNSRQVEVSNLQKQVITDPDSVDIHDVTTAMAKARMSLDLAQTVIQRLVDGWNEISQNR